MRTCPCWSLVLLLAVACHPRGTTQPEVFAAMTVGPAGGELEVTSGIQAGLRITVPPGAVSTDVQLRVLDAYGPFAAGLLPTLPSLQPGKRFRVEPADLYFDQPVTLRMPYDPVVLTNTAPGNVRVQQTRSSGSVQFEPDAVNAVTGRVDHASRTLGEFQVVRGPQVIGLAGYQGPRDQPVTLAGATFVAEAVPETSPFAGPAAVQWHLTAPGFDEVLFFDGGRLRGRESAPAWRESWNEPVQVWRDDVVGVAQSTMTTTEVQAPIGLTPFGGTIVALGSWSWDLPRTFAGRQVFDVVRLELTLAWQRNDLGTGQRAYVFWFAPEVGLVAMAIDGVVHARTAP